MVEDGKSDISTESTTSKMESTYEAQDVEEGKTERSIDFNLKNSTQTSYKERAASTEHLGGHRQYWRDIILGKMSSISFFWHRLTLPCFTL